MGGCHGGHRRRARPSRPPSRSPALYPLIGLAGAGGGLFLIPCESFLQIRPPAERKGAVWASANFASFRGMSLASLAYTAPDRPGAPADPRLRRRWASPPSSSLAGWRLEFRRKEWA